MDTKFNLIRLEHFSFFFFFLTILQRNICLLLIYENNENNKNTVNNKYDFKINDIPRISDTFCPRAYQAKLVFGVKMNFTIKGKKDICRDEYISLFRIK